MTLPSSDAGSLTETVGLFEVDTGQLAGWLRDGLSGRWRSSNPSWTSLDAAASVLAPHPRVTRYAVIPMHPWTVILNNAPNGTDVGALPSQAARELGCVSVRAVRVPDERAAYPARILEVFGPHGTPPLSSIRSIAAAKDGEGWVFEVSGTPFSFERTDQYAHPRKSDRFPPELLDAYLRELGVPVGDEPDWGGAILIEDKSSVS